MQKKKQFKTRKLLLGVCCCVGMFFSTENLYAQTSFVSAGATISGGGGKVSHSFGQVLCACKSGSSGTMEEGVQHPYTIEVVTGIDETGIGLVEAKAYPNPTTDYLNLSLRNRSRKNCSFFLLNMSGKVLQQKEISLDENRIEMIDYPHGTYFLNVVADNKTIKVFKIIKQ